MIAIDTNVLVRFIVADHPEQFERALRLMRGSDVYIGHTVLLECEWVLRSAYGATRREIATALEGIAGLANVTVESPAVLVDAIKAYRGGMDFADALHVIRANDANVPTFSTFDEGLVKRSSKVGRQVRVLGI